MPSYANTVLATAGLVSLWELGEETGPALDLKGTNPGTYQGTPLRSQPSLQTGGEGRSVDLTPATQYISVPDANSLDLGDTFSIEAWVRPDNFEANRAILGKGTGAYFLRVGTTGLVELLGGPSYKTIAQSTSAISAGVAVHIVACKTGATVRIYINGFSVGEAKNAVTCENNATALNIGRDPSFTTQAWDGRLQYVALYNVLLSAATVEAHYKARLSEAKKGAGAVGGTGSLSAKGKRARKGQAKAAGTGTVSAKGKRTRKGKGTVSASGTLSAGATKTDRQRLRIREMVPMRHSLLFIAPNGRPYRFGEDGPGADQTIEDLSSSGAVPGGSKDLMATVGRKPGVDYGDLKRGTRIQEFGVGARPLREYRLERSPQVSGDKLAVTPAAAGYEAHLVDDSSAQEIFLDSDMSGFGEPTARLRVAEAGNQVNQNAQVELVPAGTPDPADPAAFLASPAISHSWTQMNAFSGAGADQAFSLYISNGIAIGRLMLDFVNVKGGSGGNWVTQADALLDDSPAGVTVLKNWKATTALEQSLEVPPEKYALLLLTYLNEVKNTPGNWEQQYRNVKVLGRHGLPLYGTWPRVGLLASDIVAYVLRKWAPQLTFSTGKYGTIKPTQLPIPHLTFKSPTTAAEMIQQATRFELPEWGVWAGPEGPTFYMNPRGQREGSKRWRVRAHEAEFEDTGQQMDLTFNGVIVEGQAADGSTLFIAPNGSGLRWTTPRLLDTDPTNPANELGIKRFAKIQMKDIATIPGMIEAGEAWLEQRRLLDGSGRATLTGYVEDEHGMRWPYSYVEEGHEIEFLGSSIPGYRYIVSAGRSRSSRSVDVDIDAPPDSFEAMMERLGAEFVGVGLESG